MAQMAQLCGGVHILGEKANDTEKVHDKCKVE